MATTLVFDMDDKTTVLFRQMLRIPEPTTLQRHEKHLGQLPQNLVNTWREIRCMWDNVCGSPAMPAELLILIAKFAGEQIRDPTERDRGEAPPEAMHDFRKWAWWKSTPEGTPVLIQTGGKTREGTFQGMGSDKDRKLCIRMTDCRPGEKPDKVYHYKFVKIDGAKVRAKENNA